MRSHCGFARCCQQLSVEALSERLTREHYAPGQYPPKGDACEHRHGGSDPDLDRFDAREYEDAVTGTRADFSATT